MSEPNFAEGVSLEDLIAAQADPPAPDPPPAAEALVVPDDEAPADGVVDVKGTKINVGGIVAAERRRVEAKIRAEYEPLKQQAADVGSLKAELAALKAQLAPPKPAEPAAPEVSDTEAETYARRHQLFDAEGKVDIRTSKSILSEAKAEQAKIRAESKADAVAAARQELAPVQADAQQRAAHDNFMKIAATKDADGNFVFKDPATHPILLEQWNALPDHLRAVPEVGDVVINAALGKIARTLKRAPAPTLEREPVLAEAAGDRGSLPYTMSQLEKTVAQHAGIASKDFEARAKTYQPGQPNSLE